MKSIRSVFTKSVFMLALVFISNSHESIQAQTIRGGQEKNTSNIRYVYEEAGMLVFELHLDNILPKGTLLRVSDEDDNIMFEERTDESTYNIRYKIIRNNISKINFEISGKKFFLNQSFNIRSLVEEKIEVTML